MKASRLFGAVLAVGLGLSAISVATDVDAQSKGKPKTATAAPAVAADPPFAKKSIVLEPAGLSWGLNHKQVAEVYDKVFDEDYKVKYKSVSPGVKMKALDAALAEEKATFRRSRVDFGKVPTGLDASHHKGEFSYNNRESIMSVTRNGQTRFFFFIQDKLWKVSDGYKLAEGATYGKDFAAAVVKLATLYGVPGRVIAADPAKGKPFAEVDWKDSNTTLRAVQWSENSLGLIYTDNVTLANIANLRTAKPVVDDGIDPAVAAAVGGGAPPPPDPKDKNAKGKDKPAPTPPPAKPKK